MNGRASVPRKSTGKRVRFQIFERDHFTCQYCGAQPPEAVLVLDHVTPVAAGGETTPENLITACELCNQGKSDRILGNAPVRPDADLLYLSTQQEIAEIRRYQEAVARREAVIVGLVQWFQDRWCALSELDWAPSEGIIRTLINRYGHEVAGEALDDVAPKVGTGYLSSNSKKWVPYLYTVAKNIAADRGEAEGD